LANATLDKHCEQFFLFLMLICLLMMSLSTNNSCYFDLSSKACIMYADNLIYCLLQFVNCNDYLISLLLLARVCSLMIRSLSVLYSD